MSPSTSNNMFQKDDWTYSMYTASWLAIDSFGLFDDYLYLPKRNHPDKCPRYFQSSRYWVCLEISYTAAQIFWKRRIFVRKKTRNLRVPESGDAS